jgi:hypothetical protein
MDGLFIADTQRFLKKLGACKIQVQLEENGCLLLPFASFFIQDSDKDEFAG